MAHQLACLSLSESENYLSRRFSNNIMDEIKQKMYRIEYNRPACIGAAACVAVQPERWVIKDEIHDNRADLVGGKEDPQRPGIWVIECTSEELEAYTSSATMCPVQVIKIFNVETGEQLTW